MTKFKVGDMVIFNNEYASAAKELGYKINKVYEVQDVSKKHKTLRITNEDGITHFFNDERFELAEPKITKNQRITALENEVAELKLIVHELRGKKSIEPSTTNTVEDIIEFEGQQYRKVDREARDGDVIIVKRTSAPEWVTIGKPYKTFMNDGSLDFKDDMNQTVCVYDGVKTKHTKEDIDVYELIKEGLNTQVPMAEKTIETLTPNQQRAAIIEKAKKFIEDNKTEITGKALHGKHKGTVHTWRDIYVVASKSRKNVCNVEFVVDAEKRTIAALMRGFDTNTIYAAATAKCSPNDVFNEHIGKAIALGRALGLDVSEFERATQPTEFVSGQIIEGKHLEFLGEHQLIKVENGRAYFEYNGATEFHWSKRLKEGSLCITNDTNAIY